MQSNSTDWREAIPAEDWATYDQAGLGRVDEPGSRPAVLVIDVQFRTLGEEPLPIGESIRRHYRASCGEAGWRALGPIARVVAAAREVRVPVVFPCIPPRSATEGGAMGRKAPALLEGDARGHEFPDPVAPIAGEIVLPKMHASAFAGTPLLGHLIELGVDTVVLVGATTSGCIRATAIDACSFNLRCLVVEDAVYDRATLSHCVNLFDINAKYGNVVSSDGAVAYLGGIRPCASRSRES